MQTSIPLPQLRKALQENPTLLLGKVPGIHLVDKPEGPSSFDMVAKARRQLGLRRVGHGGTLDPMATGLLLILAGNATRLFDNMQDYTKTYIAEVQLGVTTDTLDRTGTVIEEKPVPALSAAELEQALEAFRGELLQVPPMHSALKKDGKRLYELAREGKEVEREPRPMTVYALTGEILEADRLRLTMTVSKGFYVRSLIDDLGRALGCGAMMTALSRTAIGPFNLADAVPVEDLHPGGEPEIEEEPTPEQVKDALNEILTFGDGRRLGKDCTLKDLKEEGRS